LLLGFEGGIVRLRRSLGAVIVLGGLLLQACASPDDPQVTAFCESAIKTQDEFFSRLNGADGWKARQVIEWSVSLSDYWDTLEPQDKGENFDFLAGSLVEKPVDRWWREHSMFMVEVLDANQIDMDYSDWKWAYQVEVNGRNFDEILSLCEAYYFVER
jgi:hypothetical protein